MERRIIKVKIGFLALCSSLMLACGSNAQENEAKNLLLEPNQFEVQLTQTTNPQLIDVRTTAEFQAGSIEGAINQDILDGSFEKYLDKLDPNKTVFVFCAKGGRSGKAAALLKEKGFTSIIDLKGGYTAWANQSKK